jgi:hypothetical protein
MGTSIAMIEHHYSHLIPRLRADKLAIEFEKGKAAIAVPSLDKLPSVIDTVIAAARNGELDQQLAEATKQTNPRKPKGKRAA